MEDFSMSLYYFSCTVNKYIRDGLNELILPENVC